MSIALENFLVLSIPMRAVCTNFRAVGAANVVGVADNSGFVQLRNPLLGVAKEDCGSLPVGASVGVANSAFGAGFSGLLLGDAKEDRELLGVDALDVRFPEVFLGDAEDDIDKPPAYALYDVDLLGRLTKYVWLDDIIGHGFSKVQTFCRFTDGVAVSFAQEIVSSIRVGDFVEDEAKFLMAALASRRLVRRVLLRLDLTLKEMFVDWLSQVWFVVHKAFPQKCCVVCKSIGLKFAHEVSVGKLDSNVERLAYFLQQAIGVKRWQCCGAANLFRGFFLDGEVHEGGLAAIAHRVGFLAGKVLCDGCDVDVKIPVGGPGATMENIRRGLFNPPCITREMRDMILDFMSPEAIAQGALMSRVADAGSFGKELLSKVATKGSNVAAGLGAMETVGGWIEWLKGMLIELAAFIGQSVKQVTPFLVLLVFFWVCKKMFNKARALFTADLSIPRLLRAASRSVDGLVQTVLETFANVWDAMSMYFRSLFEDVDEVSEAQAGGVEMYSSYALMLLAVLPVRALAGNAVFEAMKLAPVLVTSFRLADSGLEFLISRMPGVFQSFFGKIGLYCPYNSFGTHSKVVADMSAAVESWPEMKESLEFTQGWPVIYGKFCSTYALLLMKNEHKTYVCHLKSSADAIQTVLQERLKSTKRAEPVGIYLYGGSGIGKSYVGRSIARLLYHAQNLPEKQLMCTVTADEDYWSAFADQPVIVLDDFGRAGERTLVHITQMLNLIGPMPYAPIVPFGGKGTTSNAEFVILTSNVPLEHAWGTADDSAFRRRFLNIKMHLRGTYRDDNGRFSKAKYEAMPREAQLNMEHIDFELCHEDGTTQGSVDFNRLIDMLKAARLLSVAKSQGSNVDLCEMVDLRMERETLQFYGSAQMDNGDAAVDKIEHQKDLRKWKGWGQLPAASVENAIAGVFEAAGLDEKDPDVEQGRGGYLKGKRRADALSGPMFSSKYSPYERGNEVREFKTKEYSVLDLKHGAPLFQLPVVYGSDYRVLSRDVRRKPVSFVDKMEGFPGFKMWVLEILDMIPEDLRIKVDKLSHRDSCGLATFYVMVALNVAAWRYDAEDLYYPGVYVLQHAYFYRDELRFILREMNSGKVFCPWRPSFFSQLLGKSAYLPLPVEKVQLYDRDDLDEEDPDGYVMFERGACQQHLSVWDKLIRMPIHVLRQAVEYLWLGPKKVYKSGGFADWTLVGVAATCALFGMIAGVIYGIYRGITSLFGEDHKEIVFKTIEEKESFWIANPDHPLTIGDPIALEFLADLMRTGAQAARGSDEYEAEMEMRRLGDKLRKELWGDKQEGKKKRFTTKRVAKSTQHHKALHAAQGGEEDNSKYVQSRNVVEKISMNVVKLSWGGAGGMGGFFVHDDVLLLPYHFFRDPATHELRADGDSFRIFEGRRMWSVEFDASKMRTCQTEWYKGTQAHDDWCLYECGEQLKGHKNMEKYFAQIIAPDIARRFELFMFMRAGSEMHVETEELTEFAFERNALRYRTFPSGAVDCFVPEQLVYEPKKRGDCGSLILGINPGGFVEIIGMHVAQRVYDGESRRGVARPFSAGMFSYGQETGAQGGGMWEPRIELDPRLEYVKELKHDLPFQPGKSVYVPSLVHDEPLFASVDRAPAHLGVSNECPWSRDELIRMELNQCGYGLSDPYPLGDVQMVFDSISEHYYKAWEERFRGGARVTTVFEALNGGGDYEFIKPVEVKTSPGYSEEYPWVCMDGPGGKRLLVAGVSGEYVLTALAEEAFVAKERKFLDLCGRGLPLRESVPETAILILKDELRTFEKLKDFRTRIITTFDFMYTLLCRKYMMGCTNFLQGVFPATSNAVGMSVFSEDWNTMVSYLVQVADFGFAGDYRKFEMLLCEQLAEAIGHFINRFYRKYGKVGEHDDEMRMKLIFSMVNCHLIVGKSLYLQRGNLKSGCFATTILFGNLMNMFLLRYAWVCIMRRLKPEISSLKYYEKYVRVKVYGDDNINAVNPFVVSLYNFNTVKEFFETIGVKYTTADKKEIGPDVESLFDMTFLSVKTNCDSRTGPPRFPGILFLPEPVLGGRFLACGAWVTKKVGAETGLICNLNDILRRMFGSTVEAFEELRSNMVLCMDHVGLRGRLLTWRDLRESWGRCPLEFLAEEPMVIESEFHVYGVARVTSAKKMLMMPRGIPRGYRLVTERVNASVAQMDSGTIRVDMQTSQDTTKVEPTGEIVSKFTGGSYGPDYSMVHLIKRFGTIINSLTVAATPVALNPADYMLYTVPSFRGKPSWLYYFSKMFRYWSGDIKWYVRTTAKFDVLYDTSGLGITDATTIGVISGIGPISTSTGGIVANVYQTQWVSPFVTTMIPRSFAEAASDESTPGYLVLKMLEDDNNAKVYMAGGDNLRFGFMMELPSVILSPPAERKEESFAQAGEGVSFVAEDERKVASEGARLGLVNKMDAGTIEGQFSVRQLAERPQFLYNGVWSTSQTVNTILWSGRVPWDLIVPGSINAIPNDNFSFYRGSVKLVMKLQSQPFQLGQLVAYFVPERDIAYISQYINTSRQSQSILPHILIEAGKNGTYAFEVPWVCHQALLATSDTGQMNGTIVISVFNALSVSPSATQQTCSYSLWAEFVEPEYEVIQYRNPVMKDYDVVEVSHAQMGAALSVLSKAANVASVVSDGLDFANKMGKKFVAPKALDRPFLAMQPVQVLMAGAPDLSDLKQVDQGRYLGDSPDMAMLATGEGFCSPIDEMQLSNFIGRLTFYETVAFSTSNVAGDVLDSIPMCPVPEFFGATYGAYVPMSSCALGALPFEYWRGDFVVTIQVVSAIGQVGQISVVPRYMTSLLGGLEEALSSNATIIDISTPRTHRIVIPWRSVKKWLRVPHNTFTTEAEFNTYCMGVLQITAISGLGVSETVPSLCYLNLSFCLENFEVFLVSDGITNMAFHNPYILKEDVGRKVDADNRSFKYHVDARAKENHRRSH